MMRVGIISTAVLFVYLGTTAPVYAQQDEHGKEAKPAQQSEQNKGGQQEQNKQQTKQSTPTAQHVQQAQKGGSAKQGEHTQQAQRLQQPKTSQQQHPQQAQQTKAPQQPHVQAQRSNSAQQGQRSPQAQRVTSNQGGRIPDDRFRANFGHTHVFRINRPTIVGGASRFQYGGYWFGFGQPWPVGWLYTDDVYVDYIDGGYFLYDPIHPGIRVSINVI